MKIQIVYGNTGNRTYKIDGKEVSEEEYNARVKKAGITPGSPPQVASASGWPMKSDALAVHPSQIAEVMERNKRHGITGVSYDPKDGRAILADRGARRDLMALEGIHDKQGGYGDDHAGESPLPPNDPAGPIVNPE